MKRTQIRDRLLQTVAAAAFALVNHAAQAVFVSGNFDPPDVSGTHTFQLLGDCLHAGTYVLDVNGEGSPCEVSLTRLTVSLDHSFSLDFSSFLPFLGITAIQVTNGNLTGVDTDSIGPAIGSGAYPGNWWIQYYFDSIDPVDLFHNCASNTTGPSCLVDTAFTVTFFLSDANGNPIPEPASLALTAGGLGALWLGRRRRVAASA